MSVPTASRTDHRTAKRGGARAHRADGWCPRPEAASPTAVSSPAAAFPAAGEARLRTRGVRTANGRAA